MVLRAGILQGVGYRDLLGRGGRKLHSVTRGRSARQEECARRRMSARRGRRLKGCLGDRVPEGRAAPPTVSDGGLWRVFGLRLARPPPRPLCRLSPNTRGHDLCTFRRAPSARRRLQKVQHGTSGGRRRRRRLRRQLKRYDAGDGGTRQSAKAKRAIPSANMRRGICDRQSRFGYLSTDCCYCPFHPPARRPAYGLCIPKVGFPKPIEFGDSSAWVGCLVKRS